jgi:predicted regulator of Ras-like GTPase activity (Roadblock/LC7/MglB family)
MNAAQALAELKELSTQIGSAVVLGVDGEVLASSYEDPALANPLARSALDLVGAATELSSQPRVVTRVEVELEDGALFVLREGGKTIAATTGPAPTSGLVVYDLRTCLHGISEPPPKRRRASRKAKGEEE